MRRFLKSCIPALVVVFELSISVVGIVMLLSFPANASHNFGEHFRTNEVRRSIVRHAFVAGPEADGAQTIARIDAQPTIPMPMIIESDSKPLNVYELSPESSMVRLIQRFKLGPSRSGGSDPLL